MTYAFPRNLPAPGTLRGLVLDWGGVLTPPLDSMTGAWLERENVDRDHFREVMLAWVGVRRENRGTLAGDRLPGSAVVLPSPTAAPAPGSDGVVAQVEQADDVPPGTSPVHRLERGEMSVDDFEAALAGALAQRGSPVAAAGLTRRMLEEFDALDDSMLGLVKRAREAGLATAMLSNSWGNPYPDVLMDGLFDAVVISGEVGMRKPELRIYRHTAELLGVPPGECVMVDDLPHNVSAAAAAGMVGVLHRSYEETLGELEILFDRNLR